ncbi:MAG: transposase [Planctomycetota bacterium]|jgi:transposase
MMGKAKKRAGKLFYTGFDLSDRVPANHRLRVLKEMVDFSFVRQHVRGLYGQNGHESLDPALVLKLMFLGFFENVRSERELVRALAYRLDWLWFCELDLDDPIPDHSVLSKARRRWGMKVFEEVFSHVLGLCREAGLVDAKTVYADATVLKANASLDSRVPRWFWRELEDHAGEGPESDGGGSGGGDRTAPAVEDSQAEELPEAPRGQFNRRTVSRTDPDSATVYRRGRGVTLGYRDHSLVDDKHGLVLATVATAADYDEGSLLLSLLEKQKKYLGEGPRRVVGDSSYGTRSNLQALGRAGIEAYLKRRAGRGGAGKWLDALPDGCRRSVAVRLMRRRLAKAEGRFAEAHVRYGHRRCRWRRRWRVQIQCYLVGMVQNIGKLLRYGRRPKPSEGRSVGVLGVFLAAGGSLCCRLSSLGRQLGEILGIIPPDSPEAAVLPR